MVERVLLKFVALRISFFLAFFAFVLPRIPLRN